MYSKMVHITCVNHMLARFATVILEQISKTKTRSLINAFNKIFKSSINWRNPDGRTRQAFPMPCDTRWWTWLSCVAFLSQNFEPLLVFLQTLEPVTYVEKEVNFMGSSLITEKWQIYSLEFVREAITLSEASDFRRSQKLQFCSSQFIPDWRMRLKLETLLPKGPFENS